jgi:putative ABC transport system substrate-binding protein
MALLVNPAIPTLADSSTRALQAAARTLGLNLHVLNASTEGEFNGVFAKLIQLRAGGLVIGSDPFFTSRTEQLAALAVHHAVPAVYHWREFAVAGGLVSYGAAVTDVYRLAGNYTGRILKGDKPADLPGAAGNLKSRCTSTRRPRRRSALPFRRRCCRAPTT